MFTTSRSKLALTIGTLLLAACGGGSSTGPDSDWTPPPPPPPSTATSAGIYALDNIENHNVPYVYDSRSVTGGTVQASWLSGEVNLKSDHTFTMKMVGKTTGPGYLGLPTTQNWSGTWEDETGGIKLIHTSGVAHYFFTGNNTELNVVANYTKMSGGSGSLGFTYKKQ